MPTGIDRAAPPWLMELADGLFREMMDRLAGIALIRREGECPRSWDMAVSARIEGTYRALLVFQAERALVRRLTRRMMGSAEVTDEDEEVYAQEFLNIVCGHLLGGIYRKTRMPARFYPPRLLAAEDTRPAGKLDGDRALVYVSDRGERARLVWSSGDPFPEKAGEQFFETPKGDKHDELPADDHG